MKSSRAKLLDAVARLGLVSRAAILTATVGGVGAAIFLVQEAIYPHPQAGAALALAAGACWLGALVGLASISAGDVQAAAPQAALVRLLLGTVARLAPPLAVATLAVAQDWSVLDAGLAPYLLTFYLLTLALETVFSLPRASSAPRAPAEAF